MAQEQKEFLQKLDTPDRYLYQCQQILAAIVPENPNYRAQVSQILIEYNTEIVGEERAAKVTEMIVELPIE